MTFQVLMKFLRGNASYDNHETQEKPWLKIMSKICLDFCKKDF